ncbi:Nse1 non-SMC component of SMC5-6 complex-domain-containing protein [Crucibulum laeve]|uniref:Non-structural maintenance of chromosomes element 1 homolog n=1 Tax=Crucibulum laeve TaxID=68775 RepID=A0A5C3MB73_9AGAR|nr:Nse1 non-SMC component of SMC5-6 complex-domain-containing protein [Crucibulum laeve]
MASAADVERLFLQSVLSRGMVSKKLAQTLWERSIAAVKAANDALNIPHPRPEDGWNNFLSKVNKSLDKLDLEFRHLHDETSGKEMYALVNRKGDDIAQVATDYTPAEIAFFKAIVEQIMMAPREAFSVSSLGALRELNAIKSSMSKTQAEIVLASFVSRDWLLKSKRGRYSLSTRSLLELLPYLKSTYPDELLECTICMEVVTRGVACYTNNCKTRMHNHCFANFRRRHSACPSCSKEWPRESTEKLLPVGEGAAREGEDGKRRVRLKSADPSDDEEEEDMDEDEHSQQTEIQPERKTRPSRQASRTNARYNDNSMVIDEHDEDEDEDAHRQNPQRNRRSSRR